MQSCLLWPKLGAKGFDIPHDMNALEEMIAMISSVSGVNKAQAARSFIIGLKDRAGVCPPRFIRQLVGAIKNRYPELAIHYHRHCTDGLFVPAVGEAALAGAHIIDISEPDDLGLSYVRYTLNADTFSYPFKVADAVRGKAGAIEMADTANPYHVASPTNGDLWIVYVTPGDVVKKGEELL